MTYIMNKNFIIYFFIFLNIHIDASQSIRHSKNLSASQSADKICDIKIKLRKKIDTLALELRTDKCAIHKALEDQNEILILQGELKKINKKIASNFDFLIKQLTRNIQAYIHKQHKSQTESADQTPKIESPRVIKSDSATKDKDFKFVLEIEFRQSSQEHKKPNPKLTIPISKNKGFQILNTAGATFKQLTHKTTNPQG